MHTQGITQYWKANISEAFTEGSISKKDSSIREGEKRSSSLDSREEILWIIKSSSYCCDIYLFVFFLLSSLLYTSSANILNHGVLWVH